MTINKRQLEMLEDLRQILAEAHSQEAYSVEEARGATQG